MSEGSHLGSVRTWRQRCVFCHFFLSSCVNSNIDNHATNFWWHKNFFWWHKCNGFEFQDYFRIGKTCGSGRCIVYKSSGREIGDSSGGHRVLPFCIGRTWFKLAVTTSNWFLPVVAHDKWTVWRGLSCHFRFRTLKMQICCWIVDLTYSTLWLICALNYIVKCYWSHGIMLCIYWSGLLLWTSTREVVWDRSEWTKALC